MWNYRARLDHVHDGDTATLIVDLGFNTHAVVDVRLLDVWAPELGRPGGAEATDEAAAWFAALPAGDWPLILDTIRTRGNTGEVRTFTRYVGTIASAAGDTLNAHMREWLTAHGFPQ